MAYTRAQAERDIENAFELFELFEDDPEFVVPLTPLSFCGEHEVGQEHFNPKQLFLLLTLIGIRLGFSAETILATQLSDEPTLFPHPLHSNIALYGQLENRRPVYFLGRSG